MAKRATNVGAGLAKKAGPAPAKTVAAEAPARPTRSKTQPDGRRGILVRARPEAWRALKLIALDEETTLQGVMTEAINDYLTKNGKPPVA